MRSLRLLWTDIGGVQFKGKGIIPAWREEMALKGWEIETDPAKWRDCDLVFYGSDSQLPHCPMALGDKPTILYFWGWQHARLLDEGFKHIAYRQLQMMAECTRILVPSLITMYQAADFGLPSHLCLPGVDARTLNMAEPVTPQPRVMFLSRLVAYKHLDALIYALSRIRPTPHLLVIGPGDTTPYQRLAEQLNVPIEFRELSDSEKATEIRKSMVLVHPSEYEGFGLPPLEALYCGTPVIAFDTPQMRWLLQEDAYYFMSVEALTNQIHSILTNPAEAREKAARGQERVAKSLTLAHACDRIWAHIHQVIKEHLGQQVKLHPEKWAEIYDAEHKRNWAYGSSHSPEWAAGPARFDPTWARHWRAQFFINALKECAARDILDVGCGAVYPTIFAQAGLNVTAVDISPEAIRQVNELAQKWGVANRVTGAIMDAQHLEYGDNSFDAVVEAELWEHLPHPRTAIDEGLRVLRPGGILIASTPIGADIHYDPMHLHAWDDQSIQELLKPYKLKRLEKIAEEGTDPSCYLVVLEK